MLVFSVFPLIPLHQLPILPPRIKARAILSRKFTMAVDGGMGVHAEEDDKQVEEGTFLLGRASVLRSEVVVEATHIADADGVLVVPGGVGASLLDGAAEFDGAIKADHEVVADVGPVVAVNVPATDVCGREVLTFLGGGTVDDEFCDISHNCLK